ncbi:hypothetical protein IP90_02317 [Luteimonas cucumeris]|uniref:Uncharacterized protein n=1 Tax=Luteimonas cucumeris TaxID=985012 RepID=A0A562L290_9GAMM|nr:hypothetical protein [Luteimonas cucumeris]TWI01757.1 hypothetical protein IP90_02317 [Luteimonas cucumeris]
MRTLNAIVRWACLVAGLCGVVISAWAFIDPGAFPQMQSSAAFAPPSSRWRAAFGFLFSLLLVGYGTGRLRHRELP